MSEYTNDFGQQLAVGDLVGWGHRDGNGSIQQVGIITKLTEKEAYGRTEVNATCYWVLGNGYKNAYSSTTRAGALFVLDQSTLGEVEIAAVVAADEVIEAKAAAKAETQ